MSKGAKLSVLLISLTILFMASLMSGVIKSSHWEIVNINLSAEFKRVKQRFLAKDKRNQLVFLADSQFSLQMTQQKYPTVKLHFTSEFD